MALVSLHKVHAQPYNLEVMIVFRSAYLRGLKDLNNFFIFLFPFLVGGGEGSCT